MKLPRVPKAAIFDLDGVLLDTEPLYSDAAQAVVSRYGKNFDVSLKRQIMGGDALKGAQLVVETLQIPLTPEQYLKERGAILERLFANVPAIDGVEAWVATLRAAGMPFAVGTSSVRALGEVKWARHPWLQQIEPKVCGDEVERRKPAPDIFLAAASKLGVAPEDCVVFEDSPSGVTAARNAAMQVIALRAPEIDREHLAHADLVVDAYSELNLTVLGW